jgi:hypothetical protein
MVYLSWIHIFIFSIAAVASLSVFIFPLFEMYFEVSALLVFS